MLRKSRYLAIVVLILGVASMAMGIAFIVQGQAKANFMKEAMRQEQITLGLDESAVARGEIVDSSGEAQVAGDTVREHRHGIAATYSELGRFDPTNTTHVTYMQALNLENYLYLAVASFGLTTVAIASGAFMIVTGIALGGTGVVLFQLAKRAS
jgi:hypothetical protein